MISKASIKQHFKEDCQVAWINESDPNKSSSSMTECCRKSSKRFQIEMGSIKKSFVLIRYDQVITFKRNGSNYDMEITQLTNDSTRTEVTYWLPNASPSFDKYTTISMKPDDLNEVRPTVPIETTDLLIYPRTNSEEREQDGLDRVFQQLLDTRVSDVDDE